MVTGQVFQATYQAWIRVNINTIFKRLKILIMIMYVLEFVTNDFLIILFIDLFVAFKEYVLQHIVGLFFVILITDYWSKDFRTVALWLYVFCCLYLFAVRIFLSEYFDIFHCILIKF